MKNRRAWFGMMGALVVSAVALTGCGSANQGGSPSGAPGEGFLPVTVTDGTGAEVVIDDPVQNIVCLTGACDDVLVSLGLVPTASTAAGEDGLLADPNYLGPEEASMIPLIGGAFGEENVEDIIKAEPDLVIGLAGVHDRIAESIKTEIPTYLVQIGNYQEMADFTTWVGQVTDHADEAGAAVAKFNTALDDAREHRTDGVSSLAIFGTDTNFSVETEDSLLGSILNEISDYPWPTPTDGGQGHQPGAGTFSLEEILQNDPTVIFVQTFSYGPEDMPSVSEQLAANPVWARLDAVKNDHIVEVPTTIWATGRGPISLTLVVEQAAKALYG
ncbi:MAG: ABC transporter substrate-binding protein [Microbacteriaceae bacterium]